MNWVPVARHGLILWEKEAKGSRKVSKYLPGLWDAIFVYKTYPPKSDKSWLNGVAVARHGLILWENEATGSRKVFRYLLDLRDAIL